MIKVALTSEDFMVAATRGAVRQLQAIKKGRMGSDHGSSSSRGLSRRLADSVLGDLGEIAVSRVTGLPITSRFEELSAGDLGNRYEVRTTDLRSGHLLLHDSSPDGRIYILAIVSGLEATVCGWIRAADGKHPDYWRDGDPGCYYVPQAHLNDIESLEATWASSTT
jgi:hypothetical protein